MRISSLRLRLLLVAAISIAVTLGLAGVSLSLIFERHVERRVADELRVRWNELAAALTFDDDGLPQMSQALSDPRYQRPYSGAYWQVADSTGAVLRSRSLWDTVLPAPDQSDQKQNEAVERQGPNGSEIYLVQRDIIRGAERTPQRYAVSVALDHAEINALRDSFVSDITAALTILGLVLLVAAGAQAAIGLKPLHALRRQLADIHAGRMSRLDGTFPDEVAPLASGLNLLLEQQEEQVNKARERAGDLAHGLKTPLTILAAEARRLGEAGEAESAALLHEQVAFMRDHVERELARARTRGAAVARGTATDAGQTVAKLVNLIRRAGHGPDLRWTVTVPPNLHVRMDPHDFGEVLGNLIDNARKWARSRVEVAALRIEGGYRISVTDDGPGIPDGQRSIMMQRGVRGSMDVEGSGLGFAIVVDVLKLYGRELTLATSAEGGCSAIFEIEGWLGPASTPAAPVAVRDRTPARERLPAFDSETVPPSDL